MSVSYDAEINDTKLKVSILTELDIRELIFDIELLITDSIHS